MVSGSSVATLCNSNSVGNLYGNLICDGAERATNGVNNANTEPSSPQAANLQQQQQHSPNDSGISLAEGDLLGVALLGDSGNNTGSDGGRQHD